MISRNRKAIFHFIWFFFCFKKSWKVPNDISYRPTSLIYRMTLICQRALDLGICNGISLQKVQRHAITCASNMHVRFKLSIKIEKDLRNNIFLFISLHVMTQGIDKRWQGVYIHVSVKFWLFYENGGKSTEVNFNIYFSWGVCGSFLIFKSTLI